MKQWLWFVSLIWLGLSAASDMTAERQAELENMLIQDCGSCHGLQFKGGLGPALLPQNLAGKPREFLLHSILQGRAGTAMPPWNALLDAHEANWMLDRLLTGFARGDKP